MFDIWANESKEVTPWMRMRIYWVDERCVPAEDYESNYGTMRRLLLDEEMCIRDSIMAGSTWLRSRSKLSLGP